jgi:hypothetical protein
VPDLGSRVVNSTPQFSVKNYSSADPRSQGHTNNRAPAFTRALPHFPDGRSVCIVFDYRRQSKFTGQRRRQSKAVKACQVGRLDGDPLSDIDRPRNDDRDRTNPPFGFALLPALFYCRYQFAEDVFRLFSVGRVLLEAKVNVPVFIHGRRAQVGPAKIGGKYYFSAR